MNLLESVNGFDDSGVEEKALKIAANGIDIAF